MARTYLIHREIQEASDQEIILQILKQKYDRMINKESVFGKRIAEIRQKLEANEAIMGKETPQPEKDIVEYAKENAGDDQYALIVRKRNGSISTNITEGFDDPRNMFMLFYMLFRRYPEIDRDAYWDTLRKETEDMIEMSGM